MRRSDRLTGAIPADDNLLPARRAMSRSVNPAERRWGRRSARSDGGGGGVGRAGPGSLTWANSLIGAGRVPHGPHWQHGPKVASARFLTGILENFGRKPEIRALTARNPAPPRQTVVRTDRRIRVCAPSPPGNVATVRRDDEQPSRQRTSGGRVVRSGRANSRIPAQRPRRDPRAGLKEPERPTNRRFAGWAHRLEGRPPA
jgi:hypothetical protein